MHTAEMPGGLARSLGKVLAALVLLGAPLGAVAALQPWQSSGGAVSLAPGDDAVADGLMIVERPLATSVDSHRGAASDGSELATVVNGWTYTGGRGNPNPSPGH